MTCPTQHRSLLASQILKPGQRSKMTCPAQHRSLLAGQILKLSRPGFPVRPDWRIRTGFRDARLRTGTLFFFFFFKQNWYLWVWPTSYNRVKISYTFTESHLHIQKLNFYIYNQSADLHVVNPSKCVGPAVCGCLLMSSPVPTRIKTRAKIYA